MPLAVVVELEVRSPRCGVLGADVGVAGNDAGGPDDVVDDVATARTELALVAAAGGVG